MNLNYDYIRDALLYLEDILEYTDNQMVMTHKRLTISTSISIPDKVTITSER